MAVFDCGSKALKAGYPYSFPSDEEPRVVTPNAVEVSLDRLGSHAAASTSEKLVMHPINRAQIQSLEGLEALIYYVLYDMLAWEHGQEGNVLFAEPMMFSRRQREELAQLMFEVFNVQGFFAQDQPTCALYALGKVSGCVVDIGHGKIDVSTVTDGQVSDPMNLAQRMGQALPLAPSPTWPLAAAVLVPACWCRLPYAACVRSSCPCSTTHTRPHAFDCASSRRSTTTQLHEAHAHTRLHPQVNSHTCRRLGFAGEELTIKMQQLMTARGRLLTFEQAEALKEMCAAVAGSQDDFHGLCGRGQAGSAGPAPEASIWMHYAYRMACVIL